MTNMQILRPTTKEIPTHEILHGVKIIDNYRWLEDTDNLDVKNWVLKQNIFTDKVLNEQPDYKKWQRKVEKYTRLEKHGMPYRKDGFSFYTFQSFNDDLPTIIVEDNNGVKRELLNLSKIYKKKSVNLDFWSPSHDSKFLLYGISENGSEISTLRIRDVASGKDLKDIILNVNGSVNWLDDSKSFFYDRGPIPGTVHDNDLRMNDKLYIHKIGDEIENDVLIFGDNRPAEDMINISRRFGSRYLAIRVSSAWSFNDIYLYDIKNCKIISLFVDKNARFDVDSLSDRLIIATNYNAPNGQILSVTYDKIDKNIEEYIKLIPESNASIEYYSVSKSRLFVGYLRDASIEVEIYDYSGHSKGKMPAPDICDINIFASSLDNEVYYTVETMVQVGTIYKLDAISLESSVYYNQKLTHNPNDYIIKREWAISKDGTKLPIFIVHKNNLKINGKIPTILYGYGGFSVSCSPTYIKSNMAWLDRGGIYVNAVIRGGGEFGEKWHNDGILDKKQNVFDDFIACAEYLQSKKYTDNNHLAIYGGSNGGLLVGAVSMQRPELFKTVICAVPLLDMIHFQTLLIASRWMAEYGNPEKSNDFKWLYKWSPYHNVNIATKYPSFFIRTSDNDTRVHPMHSLKMVAKLQNVKKPNTTLLRLEKNSGHTASKPRLQVIKTATEQLVFVAWQLGLHI